MDSTGLTAAPALRPSKRMTDAAEDCAAPCLESAAAPARDFRQLVELYSPRLYRVAYRMTRQAQDAEDLVQETFLRAYRAWPAFDGRANPATWLYRICVNAGLDWLRRQRSRPHTAAQEEPPELVSAAPDPERLALSREARRRIDAALQELSPKERAAFALRHGENWSIAEIAAALGLREAATKNTIFRGVRKLRRALGEKP
jgi:RNA polymerase sigma-70 factor (ECF subfamily)